MSTANVVFLSALNGNQFFTANGAINYSGNIYTYLAGTLTAQNTYTNYTGGTLNPNPIPVNNDGYLNNEIWIPEGSSLRVRIVDQANNLLQDIDQIPGVNDLSDLVQYSFGTYLNANSTGTVNFGIPQTPWEAAAGVIPSNTAYGVYPVNVLRYGADPTGANSSANAVNSAFSVMCALSGSSGIGNHPRLYFPAGTYKIDASNTWANPTGTVVRGVIVEGDGISSTILQLTSGNTNPIWLYNGARGEQDYISFLTRDLMIQGDNATLCNGHSWYISQGWRFENVYWNNMAYPLAVHGDFGGDSVKAVTCKMNSINGACMLFDSDQSLNNEFHSCDFENLNCNVFSVTANGGGAVRVYGGSYICNDAGYITYFLALNGGGLADNNNNYTFYGMQSQWQAANCCTVYTGATGDEAPTIVFNECNITETNGQRVTANITDASLIYNNCTLTENQDAKYVVYGPASAGDQYGMAGQIIFNGCEVLQNLVSVCNTANGDDGLAWGYISARGCWASEFQSTVSRFFRVAVDFDLNWQNTGRGNNWAGVKHYNAKQQNRAWSSATANNVFNVQLPAGALVTGIYAYRPAGTTNTPYSIYIGNGNQSVTYCSNTSANSNQAISVQMTNTLANAIAIGSSDPSQNLSLWISTTASEQVAGGYWTIDYY